jgi:hypothetical protein
MKIQVVLFLSILILSCNSDKSTCINTPSVDKDTINKFRELVLVKPNNISLDYILVKNYSDSAMGKLDDQSCRLKCIMTNNNNFSVFLVGYTCTDLPGKLKVEPNEFYDWQFLNCNMSWPYIHKIEPQKSFEFSTNLRSRRKSQIENLGIYTKFVDRLVNFDTLRKKPELIKRVIYTPYEESTFLEAKALEKLKVYNPK